MGKPNPEQQPSLEFEPDEKPEEQSKPLESVDSQIQIQKDIHPTAEELIQGWCSQEGMPEGDGTCSKCIRAKRKRGEEYPPDKPLLPSLKVRKGKFQNSAGTAPGAPGSPEWEDMKKKVSAAVEEHHRKHNEYLKRKGLPAESK